jgi:hypothetical protein
MGNGLTCSAWHAGAPSLNYTARLPARSSTARHPDPRTEQFQGANEQDRSLVAQGVRDGCATQLTTGIPRPAQICPMAGPICPDISAAVKTFPFTLLQA